MYQVVPINQYKLIFDIHIIIWHNIMLSLQSINWYYAISFSIAHLFVNIWCFSQEKTNRLLILVLIYTSLHPHSHEPRSSSLIRKVLSSFLILSCSQLLCLNISFPTIHIHHIPTDRLPSNSFPSWIYSVSIKRSTEKDIDKTVGKDISKKASCLWWYFEWMLWFPTIIHWISMWIEKVEIDKIKAIRNIQQYKRRIFRYWKLLLDIMCV